MQYSHAMIPQTLSPVPPPMEWTWSGLGVTTPQHLRTQPQLPDWSVAAVKAESPNETVSQTSAPDPVESIPTQTKKRTLTGNASENLADDDVVREKDMPEAKKQHSSPPRPTPPKRPPFPFQVPKARPVPSHTRSSSTLNPFASEFVFRPPSNVPTLSAAAKEFSPVHLQESSKSLFNVFAPEFNPSKSTLLGGSFALGKTALFPRKESDNIFVKPSPTKKVIPIVRPDDVNLEDSEGESTEELEEDTSNEKVDQEESDPATEEEIDDDVETELLEEEEDEEEEEQDENVEPTPSSYSGISNNEPAATSTKSHHEELATPDSNQSNGSTPHPTNRSLAPPAHPRSSHLAPPSSLDREFNGLPVFWEQRLLKSEQKAKRDRALTPRGRIAQSLAKSDDDSEEANPKLKLPPFLSGFLSDCSGSLGPTPSRDRQSKSFRESPSDEVHRLIKLRLQPALARMEMLQGLLEGSMKDKPVVKKAEDSDADDEADEMNPKRTRTSTAEKIKAAVVEALRQEKDLFAAPPVVVDTSVTDKEIRDLKLIIDGLKSKLLDAEDSLNREERRRTEYERKVEMLSRELLDSERELDSKTEETKQLESQVRELQRNYDQAKRGWEDEKHTHQKLEEVISGIRSSLGQMTDKNAKLSQEVSELQSLSASQKDDISTLREDISKARGENGKLSRERTRLEREVEDERKRFTNLQSEFMETGKAIAEQETRWREELAAEKLRVQSLERNLADEERRVKKMEDECEKLAKIAEERVKLKAMVEISVQRERKLEKAKEELERRIYAAEAQVNVVKEERTRFENAISAQYTKQAEGYKTEISSLTASKRLLEAEKITLTALLEREKTNLALQSAKIESFEKDLRHAKQTANDQQKAADNAAHEMDVLRMDISAYQQDLTALRAKAEKKDGQIDALRQAAEIAKAEMVEKDKLIAQLEFLVATTTSPKKKPLFDDSDIKLQKREKEILRLRGLLADLVRDNEELVAQSSQVVAPENQKKYVAMKNILRAERDKRKDLEKQLAKMMAKESKMDGLGRTPGSRSVVSAFDTPASVLGGLDTPVSLKDTPSGVREFTPGEDTPLKGKGVLVE